MLASGAVPAVIVILLRSSTPESPRWSQAHGKLEEARHVFAQLGEEMPADQGPSPQRSWGELFSPRFLKRTLLVTIPWFILDVAGYGMTTFLPLVLTVLLAAPRQQTTGPSFVQRDINATQDALWLEIPILVGFAAGIFLIEAWGRIRLQVLGFIGMTTGLFLVAWGTGPNPVIPLVLAGFALFNLSQNGPGVSTYAMPAELFPTRLRATAHGLAAAVGKIGAAVGIALFPVVKANLGLRGTALIIAGLCVVAAVVTMLCAVEARGRSLEELGGE
jgi:MFS family permease